VPIDQFLGFGQDQSCIFAFLKKRAWRTQLSKKDQSLSDTRGWGNSESKFLERDGLEGFGGSVFYIVVVLVCAEKLHRRKGNSTSLPVDFTSQFTTFVKFDDFFSGWFLPRVHRSLSSGMLAFVVLLGAVTAGSKKQWLTHSSAHHSSLAHSHVLDHAAAPLNYTNWIGKTFFFFECFFLFW